MTEARAGFLVLCLGMLVYANSLGNGFAYDDNAVILHNSIVTSGDWRAALTSPYHPDALEGAGLFRPLTSVSFTLEWMVFGEGTLGYHFLNLLAHAGVSLLVFLFLTGMVPVVPALVGGAIFAVHPVHTEAVANIVGRGELYSAMFYLGACILYLRGAATRGTSRYFRLMALGGLYALSLSAKEIGVTLPLMLLVLEAFRPLLRFPVGTMKGGGGEGGGAGLEGAGLEGGLKTRVLREAGTYILLFVVLLFYMAFRGMALGTFTGEVPAAIFGSLGGMERVLTAISVWPQYLRLLLFPLDLSVDYDPGVLFPAEGLDLGVLLGIGVIGGLGFVAFRTLRGGFPFFFIALGILWFALSILPVANLLFPVGTLLAERTLYLPSVGLSMVGASLAVWILEDQPRAKRAGLVFLVLVLTLFSIKTVLRNPAWMNTFVVLETLNQEHPESHLAFLNRGVGLERVGEPELAREEFEMAVRLVPLSYGTLTAAAGFWGRMGDWRQAETLLRRAMELAPGRDDAYRLLSAQMLLQGRGREAHGIALWGLAEAGFHPDLWGAVSESYILKGDIQAAYFARQAAMAADPTSGRQWDRLADLLDALDRGGEAEAARAEARRLEPGTGEDLPGSIPSSRDPSGRSNSEEGPAT